MEDNGLSLIVGKTILVIRQHVGVTEEFTFVCSDGSAFRAATTRRCGCESVRVYDIQGSLCDLLDQAILEATEEVSEDWPSDVPEPPYLDSYTWTTHKFTTAKGTVSVRWVGTSNGYYSERVHFTRTHVPQPY